LYVGTSAGTVEVFESESGCHLQLFSWHASSVNALIELPPEIKQCICAECSSAKCVPLTHQLLHKIDTQRVSQESSLQRDASNFTSIGHISGLNSMQKSFRSSDSPLMVSIGNDLAESIKINCENKSHDVILFTWTGLPKS